jgi:3,4-dihydroxy 2-butanone 4-phosphate synthase/GTP cyclohydrolase II
MSFEARIREGEFCILKDDATREDEADLVIHPDGLTPEKMAFLLRHSTGIVCVPVTPETASRLQLPPMVASPTDPFSTGFTVSVDAIGDGVTTGVSACDRIRTAQLLADTNTTPSQLSRPGHTFPLVARPGLLDDRRGHTEGSLSMMQMAKKSLVAVIGELANDDGTMMRGEQLEAFAAQHSIPVVHMSQLTSTPIPYAFPSEISSCIIPRGDYTTTCKVFEYRGDTIVALIRGDVRCERDVPCRIHSGCITGDILSSKRCDCGDQLRGFMSIFDANEKAILLYVPTHEGRGIGIGAKIKAYHVMQTEGCNTFEANRRLGYADDLRDMSPFAHILRELGVQSVHVVTNNPDKVTALGSLVSKVVSTNCLITPENYSYLQAKAFVKDHSVFAEDVCPIADPDVSGRRVTVIRTRRNKRYVDSMTEACLQRLQQCGMSKDNVKVMTVPGAFDLIGGCLAVKDADVVICIGVLLQGETDHYTFLLHAVANGLAQVQLTTNRPVVNGVLTCKTSSQAEERSVRNNLGVSYADAALDTIRNF